MKNQNFEDFLRDEHAKEYIGYKDKMVDAFEDWLSNMDIDKFLIYGDMFGNSVRKPATPLEPIDEVDKLKDIAEDIFDCFIEGDSLRFDNHVPKHKIRDIIISSIIDILDQFDSPARGNKKEE